MIEENTKGDIMVNDPLIIIGLIAIVLITYGLTCQDDNNGGTK